MNRIIILIFLPIIFVQITGHSQSLCIEELSTISVSPAMDIGLKDQFLYVNPGNSEIKTYDISDPTNPNYKGSTTYSHSFAQKIDVYGNTIYLSRGPENNLILFDITNPLSPTEQSILALPPGVHTLSHLSNYSYAFTSDTLFVINTTNKKSPYIENKIVSPNNSGYIWKSYYSSSKALYIGSENGLLIYDNSDQSLPSYHSVLSIGKVNISVDSINNRLYVLGKSTGYNTLYLYDINDPLTPLLIYQGFANSSNDILAHKNILIQKNQDQEESISYYKTQNDTIQYITNFKGSKRFSITKTLSTDSLVIISKNGGIEILKYRDCPITALNNFLESPHLSIYPNPTQDFINIDLNNESKGLSLKIVNSFGRLIEEKEILKSVEHLSLLNYEKGIYLVSIIRKGEVILKQKIYKE